MTVAWVWVALPLLMADPPRVATNTPFFFNDTATTEIYSLSLHDALPISIVPEPDALVIVTVDPPELRLLPKASLARTVRTWVEEQMARVHDLTAVTANWGASAAPWT